MSLNWTQEWDPFQELERLKEEMDRLFEWISPFRSVREEVYPRVNIGQDAEKVWVYIFAPGIDPQTLDLSLERNLLSISGERKVDSALKVKEVTPENFVRKERFEGRFSRVISLPESVDPNQVEAEYRNGIIVVKIGKKEEHKAKKIQVKSV